MQRRILGQTLEVSALGLGCIRMSAGYGPPASGQRQTGAIWALQIACPQLFGARRGT
jgi:hypothetical protein